MWLIIITMTTVGYGDIVPMTNFGRLFTIFACFFGTFVISLMKIPIMSKIQMSEQEANAYKCITNLKTKHNLKIQAARVIQKFMKYVVKTKKVKRKMVVS